jgi:hypothetical protein
MLRYFSFAFSFQPRSSSLYKIFLLAGTACLLSACGDDTNEYLPKYEPPVRTYQMGVAAGYCPKPRPASKMGIVQGNPVEHDHKYCFPAGWESFHSKSEKSA